MRLSIPGILAITFPLCASAQEKFGQAEPSELISISVSTGNAGQLHDMLENYFYVSGNFGMDDSNVSEDKERSWRADIGGFALPFLLVEAGYGQYARNYNLLNNPVFTYTPAQPSGPERWWENKVTQSYKEYALGVSFCKRWTRAWAFGGPRVTRYAVSDYVMNGHLRDYDLSGALVRETYTTNTIGGGKLWDFGVQAGGGFRVYRSASLFCRVSAGFLQGKFGDTYRSESYDVYPTATETFSWETPKTMKISHFSGVELGAGINVMLWPIEPKGKADCPAPPSSAH